MNSTDPILVIGHRNPDTDAICSAVGYAAYLREVRGMEAVAACCGEVNVRTSWVLRQAGLTAPRLVLDVRPTAEKICRRDVVTAAADETFLSVYRKMVAHHFRSIPVVDEKGKLLGVPAIQELAQLFLPQEVSGDSANRRVHTSLRNMSEALGARIAGDQKDVAHLDDLLLVVAASSVETTRERAGRFPARQVVIVTGDRPEIHSLAMELGARALIITGGFTPPSGLLEQALKRGVTVLTAPQDTASASQLIRFSRPIAEALHPDFLAFGTRTLLREIIHVAQPSHQPLFPVVDEESGTLVGVFSKSDLLDVPRARLVLVDHNEFSQAVAGADEAEIIEVIDHHRLSGNLRTKEPIRFINEPVGSTSTLVGIMFQMRDAAPDRATALCLCAGIISDTLHLTSPTTTNTDHEILAWLAGIAGVESGKFARDFFAAGSMLRESCAARAIESDRKVFEENGWRVSISQIEELGLDEFWKRERELHSALDDLIAKHDLHFACLMVTDITRNDSVLLTAGSEKVMAEIEYPELRKHVHEMAGIVSRKKQLFPYLSLIVGKLSAP